MVDTLAIAQAQAAQFQSQIAQTGGFTSDGVRTQVVGTPGNVRQVGFLRSGGAEQARIRAEVARREVARKGLEQTTQELTSTRAEISILERQSSNLDLVRQRELASKKESVTGLQTKADSFRAELNQAPVFPTDDITRVKPSVVAERTTTAESLLLKPRGALETTEVGLKPGFLVEVPAGPSFKPGPNEIQVQRETSEAEPVITGIGGGLITPFTKTEQKEIRRQEDLLERQQGLQQDIVFLETRRRNFGLTPAEDKNLKRFLDQAKAENLVIQKERDTFSASALKKALTPTGKSIPSNEIGLFQDQLFVTTKGELIETPSIFSNPVGFFESQEKLRQLEAAKEPILPFEKVTFDAAGELIVGAAAFVAPEIPFGRAFKEFPISKGIKNDLFGPQAGGGVGKELFSTGKGTVTETTSIAGTEIRGVKITGGTTEPLAQTIAVRKGIIESTTENPLGLEIITQRPDTQGILGRSLSKAETLKANAKVGAEASSARKAVTQAEKDLKIKIEKLTKELSSAKVINNNKLKLSKNKLRGRLQKELSQIRNTRLQKANFAKEDPLKTFKTIPAESINTFKGLDIIGTRTTRSGSRLGRKPIEKFEIELKEESTLIGGIKKKPIGEEGEFTFTGIASAEGGTTFISGVKGKGLTGVQTTEPSGLSFFNVIKTPKLKTIPGSGKGIGKIPKGVKSGEPEFISLVGKEGKAGLTENLERTFIQDKGNKNVERILQENTGSTGGSKGRFTSSFRPSQVQQSIIKTETKEVSQSIPFIPKQTQSLQDFEKESAKTFEAVLKQQSQLKTEIGGGIFGITKTGQQTEGISINLPKIDFGSGNVKFDQTSTQTQSQIQQPELFGGLTQFRQSLGKLQVEEVKFGERVKQGQIIIQDNLFKQENIPIQINTQIFKQEQVPVNTQIGIQELITEEPSKTITKKIIDFSPSSPGRGARTDFGKFLFPVIPPIRFGGGRPTRKSRPRIRKRIGRLFTPTLTAQVFDIRRPLTEKEQKRTFSGFEIRPIVGATKKLKKTKRVKKTKKRKKK